jgi:tetratricopeptide (TPR) repeat protein
MHILLPCSLTVRRFCARNSLIIIFWLSLSFVISASGTSFAETKQFVAFSMKAAKARIENAIRAGEDFRKTQLDVYQLGGITKPWAVVLDRDSGDWIVIGERDVNSSILTLDDWAVALRARFLHAGDDDPGVTINPEGLDSSRKAGSAVKWAASQKVRFFGGVENTHFGKVCLDADWLLKRVSFGIDKLNVAGFETYYDFLSQNQSGVKLSAYKVASRFWFLPTVNRVNILGDVILLEKFKMGVFTEVLYAEVDGKPVVDLDRFQNNASEAFSSSFSNHYDEAAKGKEVLETLRGLTRLAALAKGLTQAENKPDLGFWLHRFPLAAVQTPEHTEVLKVQNPRQGWELIGGVQLAALATRFKNGDAQALKQLVLKTKPDIASVAWRFDIEFKNGQPVSVVLPSNLTDADRVAALADHAWFLYQKRRYQDALEGLDAAFGHSPELSAEAYWAKGIVLREWAVVSGPAAGQGSQSESDERFRQAISFFEKSTKLNPQFAAGQYELGVTLRAFGDYRGAIAYFKRTIELDKDYAPAYFGLGLATASTGDTQRAIGYLKQFIDRTPNGSYADDARSEIHRLEANAASPKRQLKAYTLKDGTISLRYPDDWVVMTPEEVSKRASGNTVLTANTVLVIANPDNWGQNVNVQITAVPGRTALSPGEWEAFAKTVPQAMRSQITDFKELSHRVIEVAGVPALEVNASSLAWGKRQQQRLVLFVKREKLYTVTCTAVAADFADAEEKAFQFIIDTLKTSTP